MSDEAKKPLGWAVDHVEWGEGFSAGFEIFKRSIFSSAEIGDFVSVRPIKTDRTYLGVYLGDLHGAMGPDLSTDPTTKTLKIGRGRGNPAILVPDLKRVVFGFESWWGPIQSPEDLRQITDADIQNVWYVRALQKFSKDAADQQ